MFKNTMIIPGLLMTATLLLSGCSTPMETTTPAQAGNTVFVDYIGQFEDGELFDTSIESEAQKAGIYMTGRAYSPLQVIVGAGQVIPGFDQALVGMTIGETKKVTISSEQGYGPRNDSLIQTIPLSMFQNAGINPIVGESYNLAGQMATIQSITGEGETAQVTIDLNHPMAGKTLIFTITLKSIGTGN